MKLKSYLLTTMMMLIPLSAFAQMSPEAEIAAARTDKDEMWIGNMGLTGVMNTGNSETRTFGGSTLMLLRKDMNQVSWSGNASYGRATDPTTNKESTNTANWLSQLRYDRFITDPTSIYALAHMNHDRLAGIDIYYGGSLGFADYFLRTNNTTFKFELGYDYTRQQEALNVDRNVNSARGALYFMHKFSKTASFGEDLEGLYDVQHQTDYRINSLTSLNLNVTNRVAFQVGYGVRYDHKPVAGFERLDTSSQVGLNINFL